MHIGSITGAVLGAVILLFSGCADTDGSDVLAKVGRVRITEAQIESRVSQYPIEMQGFLKEAASRDRLVDQLVDEELLYQYAKKTGYKKTPAYKEQMELAQRQILITLLIEQEVDQKLSITEADVRGYYDSHPDEFGPQETRRVRHILVRTQKEAEKVLKLKREGVSFRTLAADYSLDPSKENGGELGWITKGQVVAEFGDAAFAIPGKWGLAGPVQSEFGFHVIQLMDTKISEAISFEEAQDEILQTLNVDMRQELFDAILGSAKSRISVSRDIESR